MTTEPAATFALAADIGGTFTDVVLAPTGPGHRAHPPRRWSTKLPTTHADPVTGLLTGAGQLLVRAGVAPATVTRFVHGTTLATNLILERTGAPVAFLTTAGFGDLLELGRQARVQEERHDLFWSPAPPPVPRDHTLEIPERMGADGKPVLPLDEDATRSVLAHVATLGVQAVAICLLHSYGNPDHERRVAALCEEAAPGVLVVTSADVLPQLREYDRAATTVMSATVAPVMQAYLQRLGAGLRDLGVEAPVHVMSSSGDLLSAELAARRAVATVESGPAAGVIAAQQLGASLGRSDLLSLDMGGTTAKAAIIQNGTPTVTRSFNVGGQTSAAGRLGGGGVTIPLPAVDLAEVGAGGGSIAWVDPAGGLRLGPHSAGSEPGPACYGREGTDATVTDANLLLGYLASAGFPSSGMSLDVDRASTAIRVNVAEPLDVTVDEAAAAVHELANATMANAVHVVTVQRGVDPRRFAVVAMGGAGPVHAARLAERFGIATVIVPHAAGVGSAAGLLDSELGFERSATVMDRTRESDPSDIERRLQQLAAEAAADLGVALDDSVRVERTADVRYLGQRHEVTLPIASTPITSSDLDALESAFHRFQLQTYGIHHDDPTELVILRARVVLPVERRSSSAEEGDGHDPPPAAARRAYVGAGGFADVPVHRAADLRSGDRIEGPAVIEAADTTTFTPPGWDASVDGDTNLLLSHRSEMSHG